MHAVKVVTGLLPVSLAFSMTLSSLTFSSPFSVSTRFTASICFPLLIYLRPTLAPWQYPYCRRARLRGHLPGGTEGEPLQLNSARQVMVSPASEWSPTGDISAKSIGSREQKPDILDQMRIQS